MEPIGRVIGKYEIVSLPGREVPANEEAFLYVYYGNGVQRHDCDGVD